MVREMVPLYLKACKFRKELDEKTIKAYRIDLTQFWKFIGSEEPQKKEIEEYMTELHKKYKQKTVKRKIATLKAFYSYLEEEEIIEENPFHKIKSKFKEDVVLPRVIPRKDIERILNHMYLNLKTNNSDVKYLRDIAVIETFFATGARVYEIANIKIQDVDLNTGIICFMGKGGKERYIQIGDRRIVTLLKKYYNQNKCIIDETGYFFINQRGMRYTEQSIRNMLKRNVKQAGIERNITPHMFRHSFATYLIEEGVDISCVQHLLGHSSINTTQIYIHVATGKQAEILKHYHPRNKMKILTYE